MTVRAILSGGIGTGKSTAGDIFAALGAEIVSADEMGHRVLEPGGEAYEAVASRWPDVVDHRVDDHGHRQRRGWLRQWDTGRGRDRRRLRWELPHQMQ